MSRTLTWISALALTAGVAGAATEEDAVERPTGSAEQTALMVERFKAMFGAVGPQMADGVDGLYAVDLRFRDPITQLVGRDAMRRYLLHFAKTAAGASFQFTDTLVQAGSAAVFWTMTTAADGKRPGREIQGVSHLRVRDRVYDERDYFDLGEVYDQVPVMNWFTALVKSRLAP